MQGKADTELKKQSVTSINRGIDIHKPYKKMVSGSGSGSGSGSRTPLLGELLRVFSLLCLESVLYLGKSC